MKRAILYVFEMILSFFLILLFASSFCRIAIESAYADEPDRADMTVFVHGLGGYPMDWSNDGSITAEYTNLGNNHKQYISFTYDSDSLIDRIRAEYVECNVYVLSELENENSELLFLKYSVENGDYVVSVPNQLDFAEHCILVYDTCDADKKVEKQSGETDSQYYERTKTDTVYLRFKNTINEVVSLYKQANNNVEPKMDLIGHSRGTIVNMKYAIEYPSRVRSMFAMGGIFNGTDFGKRLNAVPALKTAFLSTSLGATFTNGFVVDMSNQNTINALKSGWNSIRFCYKALLQGQVGRTPTARPLPLS